MRVNKKMPVVTQKWIEKLRSGEYQQTQNCLRDDEGFCCLGVAADVMAPKAWGKSKESPDDYTFRGIDEGILPVNDWNRLTTVWVREKDINTTQEMLAELNDLHVFTFPMIADVVESWWSDTPLDPWSKKDRNAVRIKHGKDSELEVYETWEDGYEDDED